MDHKGPEHHYDEIDCPGCGAFFQQGEIQPETVRNNCPECGYDLRSATGGRPYRGQPSPINSEMTERNTPLDGNAKDRGGNPLQEGILAKSVIEEAEEESEQVTDPTDPAGLGELHPVKDNQWKPGDKSDRSMGRDEMLGSVRNSSEGAENWDQIVEDFEKASERAKEVNDLEKIAVANWLEHTTTENFPVEQLGWDIVDVVEPSKELTEAFNKYSMPVPDGITDNLHEALIELNAWVENPEENGQLRPYKEYWSVIRPKVNEGSIQIGVEDPHMADMINDVIRTNSLSALDKTSRVQKVAGPAAVAVAPLLEAIGIGGAGAAAAEGAAGAGALGNIGGIMKGALGAGRTYTGLTGLGQMAGQAGQQIDQPMPAGQAQPYEFNASMKTTTYGDEYEHPSSITRRIEDPVNGGIDPHQRSDEDNSDWAYDMLDVNGMGQSRNPHGEDEVDEKRRRFFTKEDKKDDESEGISRFLNAFPLIMDFFVSEESGSEDPIIQSVHDALEAEHPGYLDFAVPDEENSILLFLEEEPKKKEKKKAGTFGPSAMMDQTPSSLSIPNPSAMSLGKETPATADKCHNCGAVLDPSNKICPKCSAPSASSDTATSVNNPTWPYGTAQNLIQNYASNQQGPHTDEQKAAVSELLIAEGREDEIPNMIESPYEYADELARIQVKEPLTDEDPSEQPPMPPMEQPAPNQGMPQGIPPMGTPEPVNAPPGIMASMLKAAAKYGADSIATKCPKCDSHTTKLVNQDGGCKCHTCGHEWKDDTFVKADGNSTDTSTTSSFQLIADNDYSEPSRIDSFSEPEEEMEVDDSSHTWKDKDGDPLEEGKEYEIYANNYDIPDVGRLNKVKPDSIEYTIESNGGLNTTIEIDRKEADLNGYSFVPSGEPSSENPHGIEQNMDSKPVPVPGESTDLSTPHIQIGSSTKMSNYDQLIQEARNWLLELDGPAVFREFEDLDWEDYADEINALSPDQVHQAIESHYGGGWDEFVNNLPSGPSTSGPVVAKTAGRHYTPIEQRELIDEYGQARNADKLNLEGTHYAEADDDYFLFGC